MRLIFALAFVLSVMLLVASKAGAVPVGFVVKETDNNLTICMDWADDGDTHTRGRIPKGMIVSRVVLKESE